MQFLGSNGEEQLCEERSLGIWEHFRNLERTLVLNAKALSPKSVKPETLEEIREQRKEGR
jgi:hypothetical protein